MDYGVTLYYNTGFNTVDIPASPQRLQLSASSTQAANAVRIVQDRQLTTVRIEKSWENIKDVDYVRIGEVYYYVSGIKMVTDMCAELSLVEDYITTAGGIYGDALKGLTATATRITPRSADEYNFLQEPISPAQPLDRTRLTGATAGNISGVPALQSGNTVELIGSTVNLDNDSLVTSAQPFTDPTTGDAVGYFPTLPPITQTTTIEGVTLDAAFSYKLPGEALYQLTTAQPDALKIVQSLGITDAIVDRYSLPREYTTAIDASTESGGLKQVTRLKGSSDVFEFAGPVVKNYTPRYAKTRVMLATYYVLSRTTGDVGQYPWAVFKAPDGGFDLSVWSDPNPKGKPYARPVYHNGMTTNAIEDAVRGSQWYQPQQVFQGAAGGLVNQYQFFRDKSDVERRMRFAGTEAMTGTIVPRETMPETSAIGAGMFGIGLAGNAVGQWYDLNRQVTELQDQINDKATALNIANAIYTPTLKTANGESSQIAIGNNFEVVAENISAVDAENFDNYFQKFGYAVPGELIKIGDLDRGRFFTYVEAGEINLGSNFTRGTYERRGVMQQLMRGVRIWKTKPTPGRFTEVNY